MENFIALWLPVPLLILSSLIIVVSSLPLLLNYYSFLLLTFPRPICVRIYNGLESLSDVNWLT